MELIIVALDGSPQAEQILPYVRLLAPALQANVLLLQVLTPATQEAFLEADTGQHSRSPSDTGWAPTHAPGSLSAYHRARHYLDIQAAPLCACGISVACAVEAGAPAAVIAAVAKRERASIIALASHGYSGVRRWALGSVAEQIIKTTDIPVLLARIAKEPPAAPVNLRRLLVPLDGSIFAHNALEHGLAVAHGAQSELIMLETVAPSIEDYLSGTARLSEQRASIHEQVRRAYAARWGQHSADQAMITAAIGLGSPATAIVEEAHRRHAGLIVLAIPAHSPLHLRSGGNIAEYVLHHTTTPLLLVRSPLRDN